MFINTIPEEKIKLVDSLDLTLRSNKKVERGFSSKIVEIFVQKKRIKLVKAKMGQGKNLNNRPEKKAISNALGKCSRTVPKTPIILND